jgi:YidC/Oxa1 family membrane protein insertase
MRYLIIVVTCFTILCGVLVVESGLFQNPTRMQRHCITLEQAATTELQDTAEIQNRAAVNEPNKSADNTGSSEPRLTQIPAGLSAVGGPTETIIIGAKDPSTEDADTGFKFQLELSSVGAAIEKVTFSDGLHDGEPSGFNNRSPSNPQPLVILSPVKGIDGRSLYSLANEALVLIEQNRQFPLGRLSWQSNGVETAKDGSETASFTAIIKNSSQEPVLKLTKTYKVSVDSYLAECKVAIENLSGSEQKLQFDLRGPLGLEKEDFRTDLRKIVGAFMTSNGQIVSSRHNIISRFLSRKSGLRNETIAFEKAVRSGDKAQIAAAKEKLQIGSNLADRYRQAHFLWAAATNKYFTAILVPEPLDDEKYCDWIAEKTAWYYNPDADQRGNTGDETVGFDLKTIPVTLAKAGQADASKTYNFELYIGPKERDLFEKNALYKKLGFIQTIDFMPCCCCPDSIIRPLAFGILTIMKFMYGYIGNYGVVIIILVFLMRLILHPITKKSQVSMSKMSKLAPKAEEIKKKYVNNKQEMNKQMMALYKEQGASPIVGMLPMFIQMPIWFALYSAVNSSIALRGASFLPFWITDLSAPDALWTFPAPITVPLLGWKIYSLNLLPILMGVAFYLQQKLTPTQATAASANPQMAQQQKMMMIMMPILFPLMFYNLPSGVNLYIMTSTFAGVIEQHVIRKHIKKKDEEESQGLVAATSKTGGKVKKKKPKPFFRI